MAIFISIPVTVIIIIVVVAIFSLILFDELTAHRIEINDDDCLIYF